MFGKYYNDKPSKFFQDAFDEVYQLLPRMKRSITNDDITLLQTCIQDIDDPKFTKTIFNLFNKKTNFEVVKNIANSRGFDVDINIRKAYKMLRDIYDTLGTGKVYNNVKTFMFMLLFEPMEYMKHLMKDMEDTHIRNLDDTVKVFMNANRPSELYEGKTPCMLSMICSNSTEAVHELFTPEFSTAIYDISDNDDDTYLFDNMIKSVYSIHEKQDTPKQTGWIGQNIRGGDAAKGVAKIIGSKYDNVVNVFNCPRSQKGDWSVNSVQSMLPRVDISNYTNFMEKYTGAYNKIINGTDYIANNAETLSIMSNPHNRQYIDNYLIFDKDAFNKLSQDQQLNVKSFLVQRRNVFNEIYGFTVNTLNTNTMGSKLRGGATGIQLFNSIFAPYRAMSTSSLSNEATTFIGGDKNTNTTQFTIPTTTKITVNNANVKKSIPVNKAIETTSPETINTTNTPEQQTSQTSEPIVFSYNILGGDNEQKGSSVATYIERIMNAQREFNRTFEGLYRELIKSFTSVSRTNIKEQNSKLFECVYTLKSIEIDSPKTSVYISGLYHARNWNKQYIAACKNVVAKLNEFNSMFSESIGIINKIISLCDETSKKAQQYTSSYMTAEKQTSEIIGTITKVVKIPCKLTKEELNTYRENLQKLLSSFTSISNESNVYSLKQQMTNYINNVKDRSDIIREYFRYKDEQAKIGGNAIFNKDRLEMITQLNQQMKDCLIYLNEVIDTTLAKYRETVADKVNFDARTFDKFEKAMIQFKDISNNQDLVKTIKKIKEAIYDIEDNNEKHERRMFNLLKFIQKFWKQSGYIDFIVQLYNEFNIFGDGFNWSQFKDTMSLLLSLVNIDVFTEYKCSIASDIPTLLEGKQDIDLNSMVTISDINSITAIAEKIAERVVNASKAAGVGTLNNNAIGLSNSKTQLVQALQSTIQQMLSYSNNNLELTGKTINIRDNNINAVRVPTQQYNITITFNDKHFKFDLTSKAANTNNGELSLANMVFDAMLVNVLNVVNKYTEIKYTGNFNLPLQISTLIKGGDVEAVASVVDSNGKEYGGNVYDVLTTNDNNFDKVITEAVPFYVSAFNILIFYYNKYGPSKVHSPEKASLYFNISKLSPLYPISSKLETYNISNTSSLNMQLIKCGVGVFNVYWNKAAGDTPSQKLSSAIDMIMNEINACMVYTTQLQYESMKITGKLTNNFMTSLQSNINNLTESLTEAMKESIINISMNNEQQTIVFEQMMSKAYNKVKAATEPEKLNALMSVLTSTDKDNDNASSVYKFIDLALMPLLTTCMSYNNIFSLFSLVDSDIKTNEATYDLNEWMIHTATGIDDEYKDWTVWEAIQFVKQNYRSTNEENQLKAVIVKNMLESCSAIDEYNSYVLSNAIYNVIYNHAEWSTPSGLWYPVYVESYPSSPSITSKAVGGMRINDDIKMIIYQLYPYINGNTLYDYFTTVLSEFASDIDHCIHLMLAYPGIHDKFIKSVSSTVHKLVDNKETFQERFGITQQQKNAMERVKMNDKLEYIKPPPYKSGYFVPQYTVDIKSLLPSASVYTAGEFIPNTNVATFSFVPVDGYNQNIVLRTRKIQEDIAASYSWTDWVVQKIADCDTAFSCIPYKLVQILQQQSLLARKLQTIIIEQPTTTEMTTQVYAYTSNGILVNPITSNIITRSLTIMNQEKTRDNAAMNKQWIANLVGILPYMINKLKVYGSRVSTDASYDNINTKTELSVLASCLITFYNDLISSTPKIGFMENALMFDQSVNYHAIAELVPYLIKYNIENISSSDYSKYEWANKYMFSSIPDIIFPEYQNFDRFDKIKKFAGDIFSSGIYANEFDTVKSILGKSLWSSAIITSNIQSINNTPERDFYKYMIEAINLTAELAPNISERFINNFISILRNDYESKTTRTGKMLIDDTGSIVSSSTYIDSAKRKLQELVDALVAPTSSDVPIVIPLLISELMDSLKVYKNKIDSNIMLGGANYRKPNTELYMKELDDINIKAITKNFNEYIKKNGTFLNNFDNGKFADKFIKNMRSLSKHQYANELLKLTADPAANALQAGGIPNLYDVNTQRDMNNYAKGVNEIIMAKPAGAGGALPALQFEHILNNDYDIGDKNMLTLGEINSLVNKLYIRFGEGIANTINVGEFGDTFDNFKCGVDNRNVIPAGGTLADPAHLLGANSPIYKLFCERGGVRLNSYTNILNAIMFMINNYMTQEDINVNNKPDINAIHNDIVASCQSLDTHAYRCSSLNAAPGNTSGVFTTVLMCMIIAFALYGHQRYTNNTLSISERSIYYVHETFYKMLDDMLKDYKNTVPGRIISDMTVFADSFYHAFTPAELNGITQYDTDGFIRRIVKANFINQHIGEIAGNTVEYKNMFIKLVSRFIVYRFLKTIGTNGLLWVPSANLPIAPGQIIGNITINPYLVAKITPPLAQNNKSNIMTDIDTIYAIYILIFLYCYLLPNIDFNNANFDNEIDKIVRISKTITYNDKDYYVFETYANTLPTDIGDKLNKLTYLQLHRFVHYLYTSNSDFVKSFTIVLLRALYTISIDEAYDKGLEYFNIFGVNKVHLDHILKHVKENMINNKYAVHMALTMKERIGRGGPLLNNSFTLIHNFAGNAQTQIIYDTFYDGFITKVQYTNLLLLSDILFDANPVATDYVNKPPIMVKSLVSDLYTYQLDTILSTDASDIEMDLLIGQFDIYNNYNLLYKEIKDTIITANRYYTEISNQPAFKGGNNKVIKGGYSNEDTNIYVRVLLSGLIDVLNMPYNSYDDVLGEKTYETAIITAARLLNAIRAYKIKATIQTSMFNPIISKVDEKLDNIYNYLYSEGSYDKVAINKITNSLYMYPPVDLESEPLNKKSITYDPSIFRSFWNTYKGKALTKQLEPMFIFFNSLTLDNAGVLARLDGANVYNSISNPAKLNQYTLIGTTIEMIKHLFFRNGKLSKDLHNERPNKAAMFNDASFNIAIYKSAIGDESENQTFGITGLLNIIANTYEDITTQPAYNVFNKTFKSNTERLIYSAYAGIISTMMKLEDIVNITNVNDFADRITILKGIILVVYIKARMYDAPNIFRDTTGIKNLSYINDFSYYGFMNTALFNGSQGANYFIERKYKKLKQSESILNKYITNKAQKQPILNLTKYDFILRDTHSPFGMYSLINPIHNILNCSYRCLPDKHDYDLFATNTFIRNFSYYIPNGVNKEKNVWIESILRRLPQRSKSKYVLDNMVFNAINKQIVNGNATGAIGSNIPALYDPRVGIQEPVNGSSDYGAIGDAPVNPVSHIKDCNNFSLYNNTGIDETRTPNMSTIFKAYNYLNARNVNTKIAYATPLAAITIQYSKDNTIFNKDITDKYETKFNADFTTLRNSLWDTDKSPTSIGMNIINETIEGVHDKMETTTNTGFADNMFSTTKSMLGGAINSNIWDSSTLYSTGNGFIRRYIKEPEEPFSSISPIETYSTIYKDVLNISDGGKTLTGPTMFTNMFKFNNIAKMSSEYIFALIINYFHKYTISFNSIYNQVLFPSIIYNSAIYSTAAKEYTKIFGKDTENTNSFTKFARNYLAMIATDGFFDKVANYDESATVGPRTTDSSYDSIATVCSDYLTRHDTKVLSATNMPSINNKFIRLMFTKDLISNNDTASKFRSSSLLSCIKRADTVETFVFVILLINKYMSYYNIDTNTDISYTGQVPQDPFGYRLDI